MFEIFFSAGESSRRTAHSMLRSSSDFARRTSVAIAVRHACSANAISSTTASDMPSTSMSTAARVPGLVIDQPTCAATCVKRCAIN
jgi:hypothetical protein